MFRLTDYGPFYLLTAFINFAHGQDIPTTMICSQNHPIPQRFGQILRRNEEPNGVCQVQLPVPSSSYMILTGVILISNPSECDSLTLTIDNDSLCIAEDNFHALPSMSVSVSSPMKADFMITYYDTVFRCGGQALPRVTLADAVWTGVISSPQPIFSTLPSQGTCKVKVTGLPAGSAIRLQRIGSFKPDNALDIIVINQGLKIDRNNRALTLTADQNGEFETQSYAIDDGGEYISFRYLLIYNLIRCGDIPMINNTSHEDTDPPFLPDTAIQYRCVDNYQLKDKSSITCVSDGTDASWDSSVKCIPVTWCVDDPAIIENSVQVVVALNRTVEYKCREGYESPDGTDSLSVSCSSPDNETIPWTWNDTHIQDTFSCTPVQCNVTELTALANAAVTTTKEKVDYMETADYECDEGFTKLTADVTCQSNKTWSEYHLCEEVQCDMLQLINAKASSSSLTYRTVLNISCDPGYHRLNGVSEISIICTAAGSWNVAIPNNPISDDSIVKCEKISDVRQQQETTEKHTVVGDHAVIIGSVLGVVCILLISGLVFFVIRSRKLASEIQRLTASGKTQQLVAERSVTNGRMNNPIEYEEVGLDLSRINPAVDSENSNQVNNEANTYENSGARIVGNIQPRSAEYEMVKQGGVGEDNHVYTSLNN